jgi:TatD DNase family protein
MSKISYFDIHSHLNFSGYDADREEVYKRAKDAGVGMITVGVDIGSSKSAVALAEKYADVYATVGLHPTDSPTEEVDSAAYRELAAHPKTVAIGECGLDYYRMEGDTSVRQKAVFENMIDIANEAGKPLMLHIRNGTNRSAYIEALEILKSRSKVKGNVHFFAGSIEEAKPFLDLGYTFSFTGVLTFTHDYDEVVKYLPLESIMSETDCPYVTPTPYRGKRNEPSYVIEVVKAIARIRGEKDAVVAAQLLENAKKFIKI